MKYKNQKQIDEFRKKFVVKHLLTGKDVIGIHDDDGFAKPIPLEKMEQFIDQMLSEKEEEVKRAMKDRSFRVEFVEDGKGVNGEKCYQPIFTMGTGEVFVPQVGYPDAYLAWYKKQPK